MAKMPPKKSEDSGGDWLNTYADMVTLLLTFFVLLFACSNLDETKLQFIYQAFQSRGKYINPVVTEPNMDPAAENQGGVSSSAPIDSGGQGENPQTFDELYQFLAEYVDSNDLSDTIAVENGAAHITIRFDNSVFFDGNSYILKPEGREVLNDMIPALRATQKFIHTVTVTGHTADDGTDKTGDFQLSALRSNSVLYHLNLNNAVDYSKYRLRANGPNDPIADNSTTEGRAKNRRVEMLIMKNELDMTSQSVINDILEHDYGLDSGAFDPDNQQKPQEGNLPEGSADKVISIIDDKYKNDVVVKPSLPSGPVAIDSGQFVASADDSKKEDKESKEE